MFSDVDHKFSFHKLLQYILRGQVNQGLKKTKNLNAMFCFILVFLYHMIVVKRKLRGI